MSRIVLLVTLILVAAGCYNTRVHYGSSFPERTADFTKSWHNTFIVGLIEGTPVKADEICPGGIDAVRSYASFLNVCFELITGGIYAPRSIEIWCKSGQAATISLPGDIMADMAAIHPDLYDRFAADLREQAGAQPASLPAAQ